MTMPEMSGADVLVRMREVRPDLPVVLMSGYHEDELSEEVGAGISGFVQKPFTPADLASRMRVALAEPPTPPTMPQSPPPEAVGG